MQNAIDIRTLLFVITIVLVCRAVIMGYVWKIARQYPPVTYWVAGSALIAAGALLVGFRGIAPEIFSIFLANFVLMIGWMTISAGILIAAEQRPPWRIGFLISAIGMAGCYWFLFATPDLAKRTVATSLPVIIFDIYAGVICLVYARGHRRTTLQLLAAILIAQAASNIVKTSETFFSELQDIFQASWQISQFYVLSLISSVVGTVLFVLLAVQYVQEQLDQELAERKRQEDIVKEHNVLLTRQKADLEVTLARVKRLEGMLSICMQCKKIRAENSDWHQLERYIGEHSDAVFSHGLCPECLDREMKKSD